MINKIAINVGASIGSSIEELKKYDIIYAFEPMPFSFKILHETYGNNDCIKPYQIAISEQNGSAEFNCHTHYEYSSLLKIKKDGEFKKKCDEIDPGFDYVEDIVIVETKRLDTFLFENNIERVDFLKIDAQGSDLSVIKSLGDSISKVDFIELEVQNIQLYEGSPSKDVIIDYLTKNNFELVSTISNSELLGDYEERLTFKKKIIPVIGTAIVNGVNWLQRLISSVDFPVDKFVIFNNNGRGEITDDLDSLAKIKHPFINQIVVSHLPANVGVAGAWNLIIKSYINSPYWVIVNHDVAFTPGFLYEMFKCSIDDKIGMVHGNGGDFNDGSYDLFLIRDWVIQKIGLFDENFYPAYCEDADYIMRLTRYNWDNPDNQITKIPSVNVPYYHGYGLTTDKDYYLQGSQTKKHNSLLNNKLDQANIINFDYMDLKWGPGWRMTAPQNNAMGINDMPITYTSYDINFTRKKYLGF